jgi:hypothetical protein
MPTHPVKTLPFSLLLLAPAALAQQPQWSTLPGGPPGRMFHGMAFDVARGEVVLFGGQDYSGLRGDTWRWNGTSWSQYTGPSPSPRAGFATAYDRARQEVVIFGGVQNETWSWNGAQWTLKQPLQSPAPRYNAAMAYDVARQRIVMFGGHQAPSGVPLADTWEWDGSSWVPRFATTIPPAREWHSMAYDPTSQRILMYGGTNQPALGDFWAWDGQNWTAINATTPNPGTRHSSAMTYFGAHQAAVVFGGYGPNGVDDNTWFWNGTSWTLAAVTSSNPPPPPRSSHAMTYDEIRHEVVMFGGQATAGGLSPQVWRLRLPPVAPTFTTSGAGCGASGSLAAQPGSVPRLNTTFAINVNGVAPNAVAVGMSLGFTNSFVGPFPLPLPLDFAGMPGCTLYHDAAFAFLPTTLTGTTATWSIAIPNTYALANSHLYVQALSVIPGVNPAWLVTSHVGDARIGT